jgi:hypothetical protein
MHNTCYHTIPKACNLLCITILYKGSAPSSWRTPFSHHTLVMSLCIWNNSHNECWVVLNFHKNLWFQNFMKYFSINETTGSIFFEKKKDSEVQNQHFSMLVDSWENTWLSIRLLITYLTIFSLKTSSKKAYHPIRYHPKNC